MDKIHQTVGSSILKVNAAEVFRMCDNGPVVVMSKAAPQVVMVSIDEWNDIAAMVKNCEQKEASK